MKAKVWLPLVMAAVLGVIAAALAWNLASGAGQTAAAEGPEYVEVAVAARPVEAGRRLGEEDVKLLRIEADAAAPGSLYGFDAAVGRVVLAPVAQGQMLLEGQLAGAESGAGLQALLPPGRRAVTIELDSATAAANFLMPGSRVDLVASVRGTDQNDTARTVVQDVKVMAVGTQTSTRAAEELDVEGEAADYSTKTITLEVSPEQAQIIDLAYRSGAQPRPVLRPSGDTLATEDVVVTLAMLRGDKPEPAAPTQSPFDELFGTDGIDDDAAPMANDPFAATAGADVGQPQTRTITVIRGGIPMEVQVPVKERPAAQDAPRRLADGGGAAPVAGPLFDWLLGGTPVPAKPAAPADAPTFAGDATGFAPLGQ